MGRGLLSLDFSLSRCCCMVNCKWLRDDSRCSLVYQNQFKQTNNNSVLQCSCSALFYFSQFLADWERQFSPLLILHSLLESRSLYHCRHGVRCLTTSPYLLWSIVAITTSWEISTGGGEFYQEVWIVSIGFAETSISFHSTLMEQRTLIKKKNEAFFPSYALPLNMLSSEIWVSSFLWIRFISLFSFKLDFGLSIFFSVYPHNIVVFLSSKTKVKQKS